MEELERQLEERDALIALLNEERLRQSRIIASQSEVIGRRNRSIDQLHHMRRVSVSRNPQSTAHSRMDKRQLLLCCVARAVERLTQRSARFQDILPLVTLALSYLSKEPVRVKHRRQRSLPCNADEENSPLPSPTLSTHSEGEQPLGGLDLELIYFNPPSKKKTVSRFPVHQVSVPLTADLSPRSKTVDYDEDLLGFYSTPLGLTEISRSSTAVLSGIWGAQVAVFSAESPDTVSAIFGSSGLTIAGRRDPTLGSISWNGGQVWRKISTQKIWNLAGRWTWGGEPHIALRADGEAVTGKWGAQKIRMTSIDDAADTLELKMESGITMHGRMETGERIRWGNGQVWQKLLEAKGVQKVRSG